MMVQFALLAVVLIGAVLAALLLPDEDFWLWLLLVFITIVCAILSHFMGMHDLAKFCALLCMVFGIGAVVEWLVFGR